MKTMRGTQGTWLWAWAQAPEPRGCPFQPRGRRPPSRWLCPGSRSAGLGRAGPEKAEGPHLCGLSGSPLAKASGRGDGDRTCPASACASGQLPALRSARVF